MARHCIEVLCMIQCIINFVTAYAFNFGVMQFGGFIASSGQGLTVGKGIALDLARAGKSFFGSTPSSEVRRVFDEVIINKDFKWTQLNDVVDKDFSLPSKPIFFENYEGRDNRFIADQIVKHRIIPILRRAKVSISDLVGVNFFWINCFS
jgi:hypothetical protein